jgi:CBS domain containing-hemolysin-like protein
MWITMATIGAVALGTGLYLMIGAMRHGATFLEVLPSAALLTFGIALATVLLVIEGKLFPIMVYEANGVTRYLSVGLPSLVSIAICLGIARLWERMFGKRAGAGSAPDAVQRDDTHSE